LNPPYNALLDWVQHALEAQESILVWVTPFYHWFTLHGSPTWHKTLASHAQLYKQYKHVKFACVNDVGACVIAHKPAPFVVQIWVLIKQ